MNSSAASDRATGEFVNLLRRNDLDAAQLLGLVRFVSASKKLSEVERTSYLLYLAGRLEPHASAGKGLRLIVPPESWIAALARDDAAALPERQELHHDA